MTRKSLISAGLLALTFAAAGCATQPEPQGEIITAVEAEDGSLKAVDEDGNEVDSPEADLLLGLIEGLHGKTLADEEIWSVDAEGNLTHIQSGGICPLEWGEFVLIKPTIFKRDGTDVGCNFQSDPLRASFTFYFYLNGQPLDEELAGAANAIKTRNPTSREVDLNIVGPNPYYVGRAFESSTDDGSTARNSVLLTQDDGWRIKLRMTYPAADAAEREQLGAIMLRGQMDKVGRDSIGALPELEEVEPELDI